MSNCTFSCFYKVLKLKWIVVALPSPQITELSPNVMLFMPKESWPFDKSGLHTQVPRSQSPWGIDPRQLKGNGESKLARNLNLSNRSLKYSKRGGNQAQAHLLPPLPHPSPLPAPEPLTAPCTGPPSGFSIIYVNTSLLPGPPLPQPLTSLLSQDMLTPHQGAQEARSRAGRGWGTAQAYSILDTGQCVHGHPAFGHVPEDTQWAVWRCVKKTTVQGHPVNPGAHCPLSVSFFFWKLGEKMTLSMYLWDVHEAACFKKKLFAK